MVDLIISILPVAFLLIAFVLSCYTETLWMVFLILTGPLQFLLSRYFKGGDDEE